MLQDTVSPEPPPDKTHPGPKPGPGQVLHPSTEHEWPTSSWTVKPVIRLKAGLTATMLPLASKTMSPSGMASVMCFQSSCCNVLIFSRGDLARIPELELNYDPTLSIALDRLGEPMTTLSAIGENEKEVLLDVLALLARIFWGPDASLCQDMFGPAQDTLSQLANLLSPPGPAAARDLNHTLSAFDDPAELCAQLEPDYVRLFVSDQGGVAAPLYHSCYQGEGLLMGPPAQEMASRLETAGLGLEEESAEPPDHLAVELEYLILLLEDGWSHNDPALLAEAGEFAGSFMLPWTEGFLARLAGESDSRFYPLAAELLTALLTSLGRP